MTWLKGLVLLVAVLLVEHGLRHPAPTPKALVELNGTNPDCCPWG